MRFFVDKNGGLAPFRISLAAGALGIGVLVLSFFGFLLDQESRRAPYFPPVPNGAEEWGFPRAGFGNNKQFVYYRIQDGNVAEVADFYNQRLEEMEPGADGNRCERFPTIGTFADPQYNSRGEPLQTDFDPATQPAFHYICMFDRSGFNVTQWTEVMIYPGLPDEDEFLDSEGYAVIEYEQVWSN
jgi:hypothetical protein